MERGLFSLPSFIANTKSQLSNGETNCRLTIAPIQHSPDPLDDRLIGMQNDVLSLDSPLSKNILYTFVQSKYNHTNVSIKRYIRSYKQQFHIHPDGYLG